jgi:signal transduction histidine kinase
MPDGVADEDIACEGPASHGIRCWHELSVSDTGVEIPPEDLPHIFGYSVLKRRPPTSR